MRAKHKNESLESQPKQDKMLYCLHTVTAWDKPPFPSFLGRVLAQASANGIIHLLDLKSGQIHKLVGHESEVHSVVFSHLGENLYSGGSDGTIRLWIWSAIAHPDAKGIPSKA